MAQQEATVEADPDTVTSIVPEYSTADSIPIAVSAFDDKLYIDVPDFGQIERKASRHVSSDTVLHGDGPEYPKDRSEIEDLEAALQFEFDRRGLSTDYIPDRTNQYCMHLDSIFRCFVKVYNASGSASEPDLAIELQDRNLATEDSVREAGTVMAHQFGVFSEDSSEGTLSEGAERSAKGAVPEASGAVPEYGDMSEYDDRLWSLLEAFGETVGDVTQAEYWQGYFDACWNTEQSVGWDEIAWTKFEQEYDGNAELLLEVGTHLAESGQVVCNRTNALFPIGEWSRPTGSYVNTMSDVFDGTCPECGADKSDNWDCIQSSNRTRVPNRYKCQECGATRSGITTG